MTATKKNITDTAIGLVVGVGFIALLYAGIFFLTSHTAEVQQTTVQVVKLKDDSRILQRGDHFTVLWGEAGKEPSLLNCEWNPTATNYAEDARCSKLP